MTRGLGGISPANVQNYLANVSYPTTKDELLRAARDNGAPDEIIQTIEQFELEEYGGPQEVMKAYGELH